MKDKGTEATHEFGDEVGKGDTTEVKLVKHPKTPKEVIIKEKQENKYNIKTSSNFPIVGIGASAGGLSAFEAFFKGAPRGVVLNMAFILIQHLAPDHKSILAEIIKRFTIMEVYEVMDGMFVEPNCVYIIPPNKDMELVNGSLHLLEPSMKRGHNMPIDFFFNSLAKDQHDKAICIILSGTGSDGTIGLKSIKKEGGIAIVQTIDSSEYDGMPKSVISTGLEDYQLIPDKMIGQLVKITTNEDGTISSIRTLGEKSSEDLFQKIFALLRSETGHDFSDYKSNTLRRRIERRLAVNYIKTLDDYVMFLQKTPSEIQALFSDLLIGVTNFFRDEEAFQKLQEEVLPSIFHNRPVGSPIRVWSVGCSTGEEAYSIAILLQEELDRLNKGYPIQIFATDIDKEAIVSARKGLYPSSISANISPERLERFFTPEMNGEYYCVNKNIRDMLVFSEHSVIKDPPFSNLDMIVCRNVLIYLRTEIQKKIISLFHYALKIDGSLFLGNSETIGDYAMMFEVINKKHKIFRKQDDFGVNRSIGMSNFIPFSVRQGNLETIKGAIHHDLLKESLLDMMEKAILNESHLVGALVNDEGDVLYIHGRTGSFFELSTGQTGVNNVLKISRDGLKSELIKAFHLVVSKEDKVRVNDIHVKVSGHYTRVNLIVKRVKVSNSSEGKHLIAVILEEVKLVKGLVDEETSNPVQNRREYDMSLEELRIELKIKESHLETTNEELEVANQELKSFNEEMQSINEELQSTNEELETSKEELQSINEELTTVNAELQDKVDELSHTNNDMNNLLAGTNIATIFFDYDLKIMRYTPTIAKIINLIPSDIGRSIEDISFNILNNSLFIADVKEVLGTLIPKTSQVKSTNGLWFNMTIQPYRTINNVIEGAVVTYIDITEAKATLDELHISETKYRNLFENTRVGIMILDDLGLIQEVNPYLVELLGYQETELLKKFIWDIGVFEDILANKNKFKQLIQEKYVSYKNLPIVTRAGNKIAVEFISNIYQIADKDIIHCTIREDSSKA